MSENQPEQIPLKNCALIKAPCTHEKCEQWIEIGVLKPGATLTEKQGMCVFHAIFMVLASPKPQPQTMRIPMPPGMIPPGLNPLRG